MKRDLRDGRFLLCSVCLFLAKLYSINNNNDSNNNSSDNNEKYINMIKQSLLWFPRSIEGNFMLAEFMRSQIDYYNNDNKNILIKVEEIYKKCISTTVTIDSNKYNNNETTNDIDDEVDNINLEIIENELLLKRYLFKTK